MKTDSNALGEHIITIKGVQTHFWAGGTGERTVVLIHGGGSDHALFSWKYTLSALVQHFRVIAPDLPGYGKSGLPPSWKLTGETARVTRQCLIPKNDSVKTTEFPESPFLYHIHFIPEFLKSLGIQRVSLVGNSMGGGIALGVALAYSHLIEQLVLVDSYGLTRKMPGGRLTYLLSRVPLFNGFIRWLLLHFRTLVGWGLHGLVYRPSRQLFGELIDDACEVLRQKAQHPAWLAFQQAEITPLGYRSDFSPLLPKLEISTLLIHGEKDRLIPLSVARRAHQRIPHCTLVMMPRCGHLPSREKPREFIQVVTDFLNR